MPTRKEVKINIIKDYLEMHDKDILMKRNNPHRNNLINSLCDSSHIERSTAVKFIKEYLTKH
jgi:hypothetical protein